MRMGTSIMSALSQPNSRRRRERASEGPPSRPRHAKRSCSVGQGGGSQRSEDTAFQSGPRPAQKAQKSNGLVHRQSAGSSDALSLPTMATRVMFTHSSMIAAPQMNSVPLQPAQAGSGGQLAGWARARQELEKHSTASQERAPVLLQRGATPMHMLCPGCRPTHPWLRTDG